MYETSDAVETNLVHLAEFLPDDQPGDDLRGLVRQHGSPLLILDCARVRAQYRSLAAALPGVNIHYAVKALPHPAVIATLDGEGSSFDLSSAGEIPLLAGRDIRGSRLIHTHPIKTPREIQASLDLGCQVFVADNADELAKLAPFRDRISVLLRVGFRNADAVVDLAKKFGCVPGDAPALLALGGQLGLAMRGVSFHVGSQCQTPQAHVHAIAESLLLMEHGRAAGIGPLDVLDLGGGFPVAYRTPVMGIEEFCAPIRRALAATPPGVRWLTEPGRYLVAPAVQGIASVIGKARRGSAVWYYLDDGVYGSYSGRLYDRADYPLTLLPARFGPAHPSVLAGPTCDSVDIVAEGILLPELAIGDLVVARAMGAYTSASASEFNSIPKTKILVLNGPLGPTRG